MFDRFANVIIRILAFVFFVLILAFLFHRASGIGYAVFADKPHDATGTAPECIVTVTENEKLLDIAKDLEKNGIVENAYITALAFRSMEGYDRIRPGEYILTASMRPSEIMDKLTEEGETEGPTNDQQTTGN